MTHANVSAPSSSATRSFATFDSTYEPIAAPGDDECLLREHHEVVHANPHRVWTVVEVDGAGLAIVPGFLKVNRFGYLLTRKTWASGNEEFDYLPSRA